MGKKQKLIARFKTKPKDFTFEEAVALLNGFGYKLSNKGRTSGSRVMFIADGRQSIAIHKPHPDHELKQYQLDQLVSILEKEGLL